MRPHHLILVCLGVVGLPTLLTFFSLLHAHPRGDAATESNADSPNTGVRALFSFHTPSTLFPPSAIISLTDDNSTFFLARPADFGPPLQANGLSGQLWIGSGFGDDNLGRSSPGTGAEGELGCSDVPGWEDGAQAHHKDDNNEQNAPQEGNKINPHEGQTSPPAETMSAEIEEPSEDDGTDDHLHHPLPSSSVSRPAEPGQSLQHPPPDFTHGSTHADIQSLQESAEISGKVVLLSRGGCGFLEKVKWAQRRGAKALIVGDHTRGGALITMYARGDTSNVSISSLFTSHTTAHLLSSLIPPDTLVDEPNGEGALKGSGKEGSKANDDRPTFTPASTPKATSVPSSVSGRAQKRSIGSMDGQKSGQKSGWFKSLFGIRSKPKSSRKSEDSRRPPSSGRLDWFSEKWTDESPKERVTNSNRKDIAKVKGKAKIEINPKETTKTGSHPNSGDDFVIGVQDWRDPDLVVAKSSPQTKSTTTTQASIPIPLASKALYNGRESMEQKLETALRGGSITPGSGQYQKPGNKAEVQKNTHHSASHEDQKQSTTNTKNAVAAQGASSNQISHSAEEEHEGLWVTLTPTTISTSPFFDTLLVLVVSPLVTLTVVYALLLLRSRIRRRRWRAPKSVVDRLPIRTYHTMSCASTTSSSRLATPHSSSPATPLLHSSPVSITSRTRTRSAIASRLEDAVSASLDRATSAPLSQQEKRPTPTKSKRKYSGKQVECVVCLEEYVDGESRVMSLPCGHEFHAECMYARLLLTSLKKHANHCYRTPWLTTRRRTCPICKGDVVRSMAHTSPNPTSDGTTPRPYQDNPDEADVQTQAAETSNESPSSAIPIPRDIDLEQGDDMAATLVDDQPETSTPRSAWQGLTASMSLSAFSGEASRRQGHEDRDR